MSAESRPITRSDVRKATIHGYKMVRAMPGSLRLTPGQRRYILERSLRKRRGLFSRVRRAVRGERR